MDKILDWAVVTLPTFLGILGSLQPQSQKAKRRWQILLFVFGVAISGLTYWQQQGQRDESTRQAAKSEAMQRAAEEQQKLTQAKLDESLRQQERAVDRFHDLHTLLQAQDDLLQIMKESLKPELRKKVENIHKDYVRDVSVNLGMQDTVSAAAGTATPKPKSPPKP